MTSTANTTDYSDVFLLPETIPFLPIVIPALIVGCLAAAVRHIVRRRSGIKDGVALPVMIGVFSAFVIAMIGGGFAATVVADQKKSESIPAVTSAMERSVSDHYDLELVSTPLAAAKSKDRTIPTSSSFKTESGETVDLLLCFEAETGRAIVTDPADSSYAR